MILGPRAQSGRYTTWVCIIILYIHIYIYNFYNNIYNMGRIQESIYMNVQCCFMPWMMDE